MEHMSDCAVCNVCPRRCNVPRGTGFCGMPAAMRVSSVCLHRGEEPPLNPIVNVFFEGCNLQCIYCQNWQISSKPMPGHVAANTFGTVALADEIERALPQSPSPLLGFVTAAHYPDAVPAVINELHRRGLFPVVVYNSSGYESIDTLRSLEGLVDIYLPDLKYMDPALAAAYSHAADYPQVATAAIAEMRRQVGPSLKVDDAGFAYRGLIVRHLVLPGALDNTRRCLEWLADAMPPSLTLSLMAQYFPPHPHLPSPLDRHLRADEYAAAVDAAERLGFCNIYAQELSATDNYRPDFANAHNPFAPHNADMPSV